MPKRSMPKKANKSTKKQASRKADAASPSQPRSAQSLNPATVKTYADLPQNTTLKFVGLISPFGSEEGYYNRAKRKGVYARRLIAWKVQGGAVVANQKTLLIKQGITPAKRESLVEATPASRIVEFEAYRPLASQQAEWYSDHEQLELVQLGKRKNDADLIAVKRELQKPLVIHDPDFGDLKLDRRDEEFRGGASFEGMGMALFFEASSPEELDELMIFARPLWKKRKTWYTNFLNATYEFYMQEMVDEWWHGEGKLTKAKYRKLMGWPCGAHFEKDENGKFRYSLSGSAEELYSDHGIDAFGTTIDDMEVDF